MARTSGSDLLTSVVSEDSGGNRHTRPLREASLRYSLAGDVPVATPQSHVCLSQTIRSTRRRSDLLVLMNQETFRQALQ